MVWRLRSGEMVRDREDSHLHAGVLELLPEALGRISSLGRNFLTEEIDFGRVIGQTICVQTEPQDQIVYAVRPGRQGHSRFVLNRQPEDCTCLVVILKAEDGGYKMITAFVGHKPEHEPWDRNATERSAAFWQNHALIWGEEPIIPGTETAICPWRGTIPSEVDRVLTLLDASYRNLPLGVREECIRIGRTKSPSAAFNDGQRAGLIAGLNQMSQLAAGKAARWLALIRRDYGFEMFDKVARTLATVCPPAERGRERR